MNLRIDYLGYMVAKPRQPFVYAKPNLDHSHRHKGTKTTSLPEINHSKIPALVLKQAKPKSKNRKEPRN